MITEKDMAKEIGKAIKACRIDAGMSQQELAKKLNSAQSLVSAYESGTKVPSATRMMEIAEAVGTTPAALISRTDTSPIAGWEIWVESPEGEPAPMVYLIVKVGSRTDWQPVVFDFGQDAEDLQDLQRILSWLDGQHGNPRHWAGRCQMDIWFAAKRYCHKVADSLGFRSSAAEAERIGL